MTIEASSTGVETAATRGIPAIRSEAGVLRSLVVAAGIFWSLLFVAAGLRYQLQMYADGSIFSYSVAVQDSWSYHLHNISGRLFVYLYAFAPAEIYAELAKDARGGIAIYGFLFFVAQLLGLAVSYAADGSNGRIIFSTACFSTACLCPLVFGFPTEMWIAHALFWPTLAVCHYARGGLAGAALVFAMLLALAFTHTGGLVLVVAVVASLLPRGTLNPAFRRAVPAFLVVMLIRTIVKSVYPPDDYIAPVLDSAAQHFFDESVFTGDLILLLFGALASYGFVLLVVRRFNPAKAHLYAAAIVALALALYWLRFDHALHAQNRYYLRTALLIATLGLGGLAAAFALDAEGRLNLPIPFLPRLMAALTSGAAARAATGGLLLVMLVHAVETAKFVTAWTDYRAAVGALAMGTASDPALGDAQFVSSARIGADLNRLAWRSTTPYLSVLLAPDFAPSRLVVDPKTNYFWLSCKLAARNLKADRVIPAESRRLIRVYSCLHR